MHFCLSIGSQRSLGWWHLVESRIRDLQSIVAQPSIFPEFSSVFLRVKIELKEITPVKILR